MCVSKKGRRDLISTEDCVAIRSLEVYINSSTERLVRAKRGDKIDGPEVTSTILKTKSKGVRLQNPEGRVLHDEVN